MPQDSRSELTERDYQESLLALTLRERDMVSRQIDLIEAIEESGIKARKVARLRAIDAEIAELRSSLGGAE